MSCWQQPAYFETTIPQVVHLDMFFLYFELRLDSSFHDIVLEWVYRKEIISTILNWCYSSIILKRITAVDIDNLSDS